MNTPRFSSADWKRACGYINAWGPNDDDARAELAGLFAEARRDAGRDDHMLVAGASIERKPYVPPTLRTLTPEEVPAHVREELAGRDGVGLEALPWGGE